MFSSVAKVFKSRAMGIVMTGMGDDGTIGLGQLKQFGSHTIAQDEASSDVWGMPSRAIMAGVVDVVLSLDDIPRYVHHCLTNPI